MAYENINFELFKKHMKEQFAPIEPEIKADKPTLLLELLRKSGEQHE